MSFKMPTRKQVTTLGKQRVLLLGIPSFIIFFLLLLFIQVPQSTIYSSSFEGGGLSTLAGWQVFDPYRSGSDFSGSMYTTTNEVFEGERSLFFQTDVSWNYDNPYSSVALALFFAPDEEVTTFDNWLLPDDRSWDYLGLLSREDLQINPMMEFEIKLDWKFKIRVDATAWTLTGEIVGAGTAVEYDLRGLANSDWQRVSLNVVNLLNAAVGGSNWEYLRSIEIRLFNVDTNLLGEPINLYLDNYSFEAASETISDSSGFSASIDSGLILIGIIVIAIYQKKRRDRI